MEEIAEYRRDLLTVLEAVADEISSTVKGRAPDAWLSPTTPYGPTRHYVLASLLALEGQLFSVTLHRIVIEECPEFSLFDLQAWMEEHYQTGTPATEMVAEFCSLRKQEVNWLRDLPAETWNRYARHPWWGKRTLQWWVELQLEVFRQHLKELSASTPRK